MSLPIITQEPATCQAPIQQGPRKGTPCGKIIEQNQTYCPKHIRQTIIDKANQENIRYCDISRGCFVILDLHQSKCQHCLHKSRLRDRKRDDQKRQDPNKCLDCPCELTSQNRAKGKHDKFLRRCTECHKKLLLIEQKRLS